MPDRDPFLAHEALDRVSVLSQHWDNTIVDHPFIASYPKMQDDAKVISDLMGALYQRLGRGEVVG